MDRKTIELLTAWRATLTEKEIRLHELAEGKLKKILVPTDVKEDKDNGSYYPDKCHAFQAWCKKQVAATK